MSKRRVARSYEGFPKAVRQGRLCCCVWGRESVDEEWHTAKAGTCASVPEWKFWTLLEKSGLPMPEREVRFHPVRKWRWDYAWPEYMLAVEIDGGGGRMSHGTVAGRTRDAEKANTALLMGWRILRYTTPMLKDTTSVVDEVTRALQGEDIGALAA